MGWRLGFVLGAVLTLGLSGCGESEPSEGQMKEAMEYFLNHPPGVKVSESGEDRFLQEGGVRQTDAARLQLHPHRSGFFKEHDGADVQQHTEGGFLPGQGLRQMGNATTVLSRRYRVHLCCQSTGKPYRWLVCSFFSALAAAQDVKLNVTYVCNGERTYVESCNMRDLSDTSSCMVCRPRRPTHNGIMSYTNETSGTLKKLFPTCQQPSAQELAKAEAFKKKQQEIYDANAAKADPQAATQTNAPANTGRAQAQAVAAPTPPKNAEERAIRRCVSAGRLPATCTGNQLLGAFGQLVGQVLPSAAKEPGPGPELAGVFEGPGKWRLDFIDGGVLVNCSFLSPDQHSYTIDFKNNRAVLTVNTTPKPLVLTLGADGKTFTGPGPVLIDGVVPDIPVDCGMRPASPWTRQRPPDRYTMKPANRSLATPIPGTRFSLTNRPRAPR